MLLLRIQTSDGHIATQICCAVLLCCLQISLQMRISQLVMASAGLATSILMVTLVPESEFQLSTLASTHAAHNWGIRPLLEHSLLLRFTQGCKIFLAAFIGQFTLLVVALLVNNLDLDSGYPNRWL